MRGEDDYVASGEGRNRSRVLVNTDGRVIVEKAARLADKSGSHSMNVLARAERRPDDPGTTQIVGLGASAGGLEALEQFLANVPAGSGLAYVVVQHLDPTHKAMLVELLQRATVMPVRAATESLRVEPDVVYVIPPNSELSVVRGLLHLAQPSQPRGMRLPIDVLFCSLAREQGERAIGVVLSGMGSDGTRRPAGHQGAGRPDPRAAA